MAFSVPKYKKLLNAKAVTVCGQEMMKTNLYTPGTIVYHEKHDHRQQDKHLLGAMYHL